jgi:phenylalanyl-tRNA synthetase alpha subunit
MRQGKTAFVCTGDVYRRDEIDASHYPVFHQMEGKRAYLYNCSHQSDYIFKTTITQYNQSTTLHYIVLLGVRVYDAEELLKIDGTAGIESDLKGLLTGMVNFA